jgi:hypothetical protein
MASYIFLTQPLADALAGQADRRMISTALYKRSSRK